MRLAVVGICDSSLELAKAATRAGHSLQLAYGAASRAGELRASAPTVELRDDWESLLLGSTVDGVIVARLSSGIEADELRADQLRKLTQADVPLLVVHPACEPMLGFEIEMIRRDVEAVIVPFSADIYHPAIAQLEVWSSLGEASTIGSIEQVIFQRPMDDRGRNAVLSQLARDLSLLRPLLGRVRAISATGPTAKHRDPYVSGPKSLPPLVNLHVHVTGEVTYPARWSVELPEAVAEAKWIVVGSKGRATLTMPRDLRQWRLETTGPESGIVELPEATPYDNAIEDFAKLTASRKSAATLPLHRRITWLSGIRDVEAAAAVDRSIERGRTIELLNEEINEEESFKGVMAVGGCLLLMAAFGALLLATIVEGLQLPIRNWVVWRYWPVYLLLPIGLFLLLQLLQLVIKRDAPPISEVVDEKKTVSR